MKDPLANRDRVRLCQHVLKMLRDNQVVSMVERVPTFAFLRVIDPRPSAVWTNREIHSARLLPKPAGRADAGCTGQPVSLSGFRLAASIRFWREADPLTYRVCAFWPQAERAAKCSAATPRWSLLGAEKT